MPSDARYHIDPAGHSVELDRVTLVRGGRIVLREISAAIEPGEFIGVFGPNGAGKTTLFHALLGLLPPRCGEIRIFGQRRTGGSRVAGYLPQRRSGLSDLPLRGWDFVASAWRGERWGLPMVGRRGRHAIERALELVEARALAKRRIAEMSGGEVQRLLLAQALLGEPRLLLLDEPLASLDPRHQAAVITLIRQTQQVTGATVLFSAHDLNPLLGVMDRVMYLGNGAAAIGAVDNVVTDEVLTRLYGMPIEVLHVKNRILVVAGTMPVEAEAHRHEPLGRV